MELTKGELENEQLQMSFDHQLPNTETNNGYILLYKKDTKGKIRTLEMWTEDNLLVNNTGLEDGKKVRTQSECQGKNQGKKNETTDAEQALKELESKRKKKLREGYCLTREEALLGAVEKPMLANEYQKHNKVTGKLELTTHAKKIKWYDEATGEGGIWVQPKCDGQRSKGKEIPGSYGLYSRNNKKIETMTHITNDLADVKLILDGELYAHGINFQDNMRIIKKYRPGKSEQVKWHLYDIQSDDPFHKRYQILKRWYDLAVVAGKADNIELVPTYFCKTIEEVRARHAEFLEQGYEGTMLRISDKGYKVNGRCNQLLKFKDFIDITAELIDIIPEERRTSMGKALCKAVNEQGQEIEFLASFKASHEEREEYLANKDSYIGQYTLEIRFFEWTTSEQPVPRFPVCVGFRNDK